MDRIDADGDALIDYGDFIAFGLARTSPASAGYDWPHDRGHGHGHGHGHGDALGDGYYGNFDGSSRSRRRKRIRHRRRHRRPQNDIDDGWSSGGFVDLDDEERDAEWRLLVDEIEWRTRSKLRQRTKCLVWEECGGREADRKVANAELKTLFRLYDSASSGRLSTPDVQCMLDDLGVCVGPALRDAVVARCNGHVDGRGGIALQDFQQFVWQRRSHFR